MRRDDNRGPKVELRLDTRTESDWTVLAVEGDLDLRRTVAEAVG